MLLWFDPPIILIQRVCFISQSTAGLFSWTGATCYGCSPYEKNWQDKVYASLSKIGKKKHIPVVSCKAQSKTSIDSTESPQQSLSVVLRDIEPGNPEAVAYV